VPTKPSGQFECLFRFYGPEKPLFDKTWSCRDIERSLLNKQESEAVKNLRVQIYAGLLLAAANNAALAEAPALPQAPAGDTIPVTVDNFRRAESDLVMGPIVKDGGFGKYVHHRDL